MSDQRILDQQIQAQGQALASSRHANQLSHLRYREGSISYLDVIDSDWNLAARATRCTASWQSNDC